MFPHPGDLEKKNVRTIYCEERKKERERKKSRNQEIEIEIHTYI